MKDHMFYNGQNLYTNFNVNELKTFAACVEACKACLNLCIILKKRKAATLCLECAEMGEVLIKFKCCQANFAPQVAQLFAEICLACENECLKLNFIEAKNVAQLCSYSSNMVSNEYKKKTDIWKKKKSTP